MHRSFTLLYILCLLDVPDQVQSRPLRGPVSCPYPNPEMIAPCRCSVDQQYKGSDQDFKNICKIFVFLVKLTCDLKGDLEEKGLQRVTDNLACTEIDDLVINMNNNKVNCHLDITERLETEIISVEGKLRSP